MTPSEFNSLELRWLALSYLFYKRSTPPGSGEPLDIRRSSSSGYGSFKRVFSGSAILGFHADKQTSGSAIPPQTQNPAFRAGFVVTAMVCFLLLDDCDIRRRKTLGALLDFELNLVALIQALVAAC